MTTIIKLFYELKINLDWYKNALQKNPRRNKDSNSRQNIWQVCLQYCYKTPPKAWVYTDVYFRNIKWDETRKIQQREFVIILNIAATWLGFVFLAGLTGWPSNT